MAKLSNNEMIISSLERIESKQNSIQETVNLSLLEQGKANVRHELGIQEIRERQKKTEKTIAKNAPIINFAAKLQNNMSKIATGLIVAIAGAWVVGSSSSQQVGATAKAEVKKVDTDKKL